MCRVVSPDICLAATLDAMFSAFELIVLLGRNSEEFFAKGEYHLNMSKIATQFIFVLVFSLLLPVVGTSITVNCDDMCAGVPSCGNTAPSAGCSQIRGDDCFNQGKKCFCCPFPR